MSLEEKVADPESKSGAAKRKDFWDIVSVVGGLLIPVAIFLAGQQYATAMKEAEIASAESRDASNREVALANSRVSQANLLLSAIERLAGNDGPGKRVAISAILLAMPVEGPGIVADLSRSDPSEQVRAYAVDSLTQRKLTMVAQLYASSGGERAEAYNVLLRNWGGDTTLPPLLMQKARDALRDASFPGRDDGIYNTLVLLSHMNQTTLAPNRAELRAFAAQMRPVGPRVSERVDTLLARLP